MTLKVMSTIHMRDLLHSEIFATETPGSEKLTYLPAPRPQSRQVTFSYLTLIWLRLTRNWLLISHLSMALQLSFLLPSVLRPELFISAEEGVS